MIFDKFKKPRSRGGSIALNVLVVLVIYMGIRAWIQRDLASGLAPELASTDLMGAPVVLAEYTKQPVLVHFWATWCGVCAAERGVIEAIDQDWPVISVAMQSGDQDSVREFMQVKNINWKTVNDVDGLISERYGVTAVPTSFILKQGRIVFAQRGYITSPGLRLRLWAARMFF